MLVAVAEGQLLRSGEGSPSLIASWLLIAAVCVAPLFRRRYPVAVGWFAALATGSYHLLSGSNARDLWITPGGTRRAYLPA